MKSALFRVLFATVFLSGLGAVDSSLRGTWVSKVADTEILLAFEANSQVHYLERGGRVMFGTLVADGRLSFPVLEEPNQFDFEINSDSRLTFKIFEQEFDFHKIPDPNDAVSGTGDLQQ